MQGESWARDVAGHGLSHGGPWEGAWRATDREVVGHMEGEAWQGGRAVLGQEGTSGAAKGARWAWLGGRRT